MRAGAGRLEIKPIARVQQESQIRSRLHGRVEVDALRYAGGIIDLVEGAAGVKRGGRDAAFEDFEHGTTRIIDHKQRGADQPARRMSRVSAQESSTAAHKMTATGRHRQFGALTLALNLNRRPRFGIKIKSSRKR